MPVHPPLYRGLGYELGLNTESFQVKRQLLIMLKRAKHKKHFWQRLVRFLISTRPSPETIPLAVLCAGPKAASPKLNSTVTTRTSTGNFSGQPRPTILRSTSTWHCLHTHGCVLPRVNLRGVPRLEWSDLARSVRHCFLLAKGSSFTSP